MLKSFRETIDFLYTQLPVFQYIGSSAYKKDLTNTIRLCEYLGNPHRKFKSIHVAGTNGKGSSSHMIASVLQSCGYKTGLYTSPHLKNFTERIKINGVEVFGDFIVDFVNRMLRPIEEVKPSFFELTVAMAFEYFAQNKIDFAVIEAGLGGRLDSTNVITPEISLITNIGFDHMDILGDTLESIATEKAGIIKPKVPVVISERQKEVEHIFINKALAYTSAIDFASDKIVIRKKGDVTNVVIEGKSIILNPDLKGSYQQKNIAGVLKVCQVLNSLGLNMPIDLVIDGINNAATRTGLKGRWQKICDNPLVFCDTGHNAEGISEVIRQINETPHVNLRWVFGVVNDKSPDKVFSILPKSASYYFCQAKIPRAMDAYELKSRASQFGLNGKVIPDVNQALELAKSESTPNDLIVVGGSTFVVADVDNI